MLVREAMTSPVVTIPPTATVRQAIRVLHEHDATALPIVDESGRLVGIVGETDLLRDVFEHDPRALSRTAATAATSSPRQVAEIMTRDVEIAQPNTDLTVLTETMMKARISSVPVLAGSDIVGIVTYRDLIAILAHDDSRIRDDVLATIAEYGPDVAHWDVSVRDGVVEVHGRADASAMQIVDVLAQTVPGVTQVSIGD
ncbi:CBS domain-containing protein [Actinomadura sp. KC216]|uniref:CBS domain-containing protein n=1 Tax=Actinomadura sp. KC216 TaxID=2530370 RepID=UPI001404D2B0|nr:CBS domain-containing protein [Actinomadura sp. KC216]